MEQQQVISVTVVSVEFSFDDGRGVALEETNILIFGGGGGVLRDLDDELTRERNSTHALYVQIQKFVNLCDETNICQIYFAFYKISR